MARIELSDEELTSVTTAIKNRCGIDFTNYERKSLKRGISRLIMKNKLGSVLGLWQKILHDREYFMSCIDDLTVNLTELFRNPDIWKKMQDSVLEELKSNSSLSMWHAGCSTGEEVYTMAIVLQDKRLLWKSRALATDLSSSAIAKAKEGRYPSILISKYSKSFQKYLHNAQIENFFKKDNEEWIVNSELKNNVEFKEHNLVQEGMHRKFDIVFCRNVMIYFDDTLKNKVIKLFYDSLRPKGFFVIGYYDMLTDESKELFDVYDSKTRIYRKK